MSVTSVTTKYASRRASSQLGPVTEYQVVYIVRCATTDTESTIYAATSAGIPEQYEVYSGDSEARCTNLDLEHIENTAGGEAIWHATATYKTSDYRTTPGQNIRYPLDRPAVYSWTHQKYEEIRYFDIEGKAFVNGAGTAFESPPTLEVVHPVLVVEKNEEAFNSGLAWSYTNKNNADKFYGAEPGYAKCEGISGQGPYYEATQTFWRVTYEIHFNPYGWDPYYILNQGPKYRPAAGEAPKFFEDGENAVISTENQLLNADGTITEDANGRNASVANWIAFHLYEKANFSTLGI